ncbi:D-alanyl-D-alanine carboxypeptidase family protein [Streptomyces sp. NPDC091266]|uniref:D-alanyl-D-alanine carboxypeptidase family protein n=1 Tax=Streptomyces sp. NPDC091266 TaxID=3365978 RepID=UPI0038049625
MTHFGGGAVRRRRGMVLALSAAVVAAALPTAAAGAADAPPSAVSAAPLPGIGAKGAYLLDGGANRPLWAKAAHTRRQMASTTKAMTAVVVLDMHGAELHRRVTVKKSYRDYVYRNGASSADLRPGDQLTVRQLLYALMLPSGCDAAYALADTFGGGRTEGRRVRSFIEQMNARAKALGLRHTKYDSFDGISAHGRNYTTPRDLVQLARHALENRTFAAVVKSARTRQRAANVHRTYTWYNTNKLLGSYQGALGIKTGTGTRAGACLVFAAERGGRTVVGALLDDNSGRYRDAVRMLDYAFRTAGTEWARRGDA